MSATRAPARTRARPASASIRSKLGPLPMVIERKYFMDDLAEDILVRKVLYGGIAQACELFDRYVVDGIAAATGHTVRHGFDRLDDVAVAVRSVIDYRTSALVDVAAEDDPACVRRHQRGSARETAGPVVRQEAQVCRGRARRVHFQGI